MTGSMPRLAVSLIALVAAGAAFAQDAADVGPAAAPVAAPAIANPGIEAGAYVRVVGAALRHRAARRLSEADFIRISREPGVVVLDARSQARFDELHVAGAINLAFPDIAIETLAATLPDKDARILIYCNNNFSGADGPFPSKLPSASLNLSTYVALYDHGYRNVWELGPLIDVASSAIPFAGRAVPPPR